MIEFRPYEKGDALALNPKDLYDGDKQARFNADQRINDPTARMMTYLVGNIPIAIVGIFKTLGNSWQVFAIFSDEIKNHRVQFSKMTKRLLDVSARVYNVKRFHTICPSDVNEAKRWFKFLGFEKEGTMRCFDELEKDYDIWARIY